MSLKTIKHQNFLNQVKYIRQFKYIHLNKHHKTTDVLDNTQDKIKTITTEYGREKRNSQNNPKTVKITGKVSLSSKKINK